MKVFEEKDLPDNYARFFDINWTGTIIDLLNTHTLNIDARIYCVVKMNAISDEGIRRFCTWCAFRVAPLYSGVGSERAVNEALILCEDLARGEATSHRVDKARNKAILKLSAPIPKIIRSCQNNVKESFRHACMAAISALNPDMVSAARYASLNAAKAIGYIAGSASWNGSSERAFDSAREEQIEVLKYVAEVENSVAKRKK